MAKADRVGKLLSEVASLRRAGSSAEGIARLREILQGKDSYVVATAVKVAENWSYPELTRDLVSAFERFLSLADGGCAVKTECARVLCETMATGAETVFDRGVAHHQYEKVLGGEVDVAKSLRCWSALGLSATGHRRQVWLIVPLLTDPEPEVRIHAIRALGQSESDASEALLRLVALQTDKEEAVTAEALSALARGWTERGYEFLKWLLNEPRRPPTMTSPQPARPGRSLVFNALAESRHPQALRLLVEQYENDLSPAARKEVIGAVALSRRPEAVEWLLEKLENGSPAEGVAIVEGLAVRKEEAGLWKRVEAAVEEKVKLDPRSRSLFNRALNVS